MASATLDRLEQVATQLEAIAARFAGGGALPPPGGAGLGGDEKEAPSVTAWNTYYDSFVSPFIASSKKLNLSKVAELTETGWKNIGDLMRAASRSKKPSQGELAEFVKPAADAIGAAGGLPDNRDKGTFNHLSAYAELIQALGWVMISPTPQGHIQGQLESADFYFSKVLFGCKDLDNKADHRAFVAQAKDLLNEMKAYVKQWHTTGVEYKGQGSIKDGPKGGGGGGAPKAPPLAVPPPAAGAAPKKSGGGGGGGGFGAVLQDLNKGSAITSGLKKVTKDMKTKNRPKEERSGLVSSAPKKASGPSKWSQKQAVVKPPSITLARGQHLIEHHVEGDVRVPEGATIKQSAYIFNCGAVIVRCPEKLKAVVIDSCKKTRVLVDSVVSTVEVVNCQSVQVFITGVVNSVAVDKTNGCLIHASRASVADMELITSSISEVNLSVPGDTDDDDPIEMPVPEQFKTVIVGKGKSSTLKTENVKHG